MLFPGIGFIVCQENPEILDVASAGEDQSLIGGSPVCVIAEHFEHLLEASFDTVLLRFQIK